MAPHAHQRLRHDIVFRELRVLRSERLTAHMQRITFGGPELQGFHSPSPDDHVKLFFPNAHGEFVTPTLGPDGPHYPPGREPSPARDYTPRYHDAGRNGLVIDFVLHGDGPAATWAAQAEPGQVLVAGGPRGSFVAADDFDRYVLVGDETALPAIGRWLETMPAGRRVAVLAEIPEAADRQPLSSRAELELAWLERNGEAAARSDRLERALRDLPGIAGDTFYWIAAESGRARGMRLWLDQQGVPKDWIKSSGYWKADEDDGGH